MSFSTSRRKAGGRRKDQQCSQTREAKCIRVTSAFVRLLEKCVGDRGSVEGRAWREAEEGGATVGSGVNEYNRFSQLSNPGDICSVEHHPKYPPR